MIGLAGDHPAGRVLAERPIIKVEAAVAKDAPESLNGEEILYASSAFRTNRKNELGVDESSSD